MGCKNLRVARVFYDWVPSHHVGGNGIDSHLRYLDA